MPSIVKTVPFDSVQWDLNGRPTVPNFFKTTTTGGPLQTRATQTVPRMDLVGRIVALDCEFQEVYIEALGKCRHRVGRVSIVNYYGDVIYDVFAWYPEEPGKRKKLPSPSMKLGVYWADIKLRNGACHIQEVEYNVNAILRKAEIVVGHAIHEDIKVFSEGFWKGIETRDTQAYSGYRKHNGGPKKLSVLSIEILDGSIQGEEHSSAEDAWATMSLFRVNEDGIEREQGGMMWQPLEDEGGDDAEYADELEEDPQSAEDAALEQAMVELQEARSKMLLTASAAFWQSGSTAVRTNTETPGAKTTAALIHRLSGRHYTLRAPDDGSWEGRGGAGTRRGCLPDSERHRKDLQDSIQAATITHRHQEQGNRPRP